MAAPGRPTRIAIARQGGGAQTSFVAGALEAILEARAENGGETVGGDAARSFEIVALSGTSGGAICAAQAWFELQLEALDAAPGDRLRRFWRGGYPNGVTAETLPVALQEDISSMFTSGQWPWRRTLDSLRAEVGDWAMHQDFPGRSLPFQISARLRPYYFDNAFAWLDGAPGVGETRHFLETAREQTAKAMSAVPGPFGALAARLIDDAFELNPLLPDSDLRKEFDALDAFRASINRAFGGDLDALLKLVSGPGRDAAKRPELLIGAADVNRTVKLDDLENQDYANRTSSRVFRASENLGRLEDMLLASAAMPEMMRAVEIDGDHFWDGAFSQNPPILDLPDVHGETFLETTEQDLEDGDDPRHPEEIWLMLINPSTRPDTPRELDDIDDRKIELAGNISLSHDVHTIRKMNGVRSLCPRSGRTRLYRNIRFRAIEMTDRTKLGLRLPSKLDRRRVNIEPLYDEGRSQALSFLESWRRGDQQSPRRRDPKIRRLRAAK